MKTYIALFRGINVGGKNSLPMKELVALLQQNGCEHVKTYIQSGNVVFQTQNEQPHKLAEAISSAIAQKFGFQPKILLLQKADLEKAVAHNSFSTQEGKALHFFFLESIPAKPNLEGLAAVQTASEEFQLIDKVLYLYAPQGVGRSKLAAKIEPALRVTSTARNWNTISKLMEMLAD